MAGSNIFNHSELACRRAAKKAKTNAGKLADKAAAKQAMPLGGQTAPTIKASGETADTRPIELQSLCRPLDIDKYLKLVSISFGSAGELFWHIIEMTTTFVHVHDVNRVTSPLLNILEAGDFIETNILRSTDIYYKELPDEYPTAVQQMYAGRRFMREYSARCKKYLKGAYPSLTHSFSASVFIFPRLDGIIFDYTETSFRTIAILECAERVANWPPASAIALRAVQLFAWKCADLFAKMQNYSGISMTEQEQASRFAIAWRGVAATVSMRTGRV